MLASSCLFFVAACGSDQAKDAIAGPRGGGAQNNSGGGAQNDNGGAPSSNGGTGIPAAGAPDSTPGAVTISPKAVTVAEGAMQAFTCSIGGSPNGRCTFALKEAAGGAVSDVGIYTAPKTAGVYHVTATNSADTTKSDTALITVAAANVAACDKLPPAGTWENITPPEVLANFGKQTDYGVYAFVVDPVNSGTVYLGTVRSKVWKTTDCGATWSHVNVGRNGPSLDTGINWTFLLDPTDSKVLYINSGYASDTNGAYKSVNSGVDWDPVWPPPNQPDLAKVVDYNFANTFAMDPADHLHLLLTFHSVCSAPYKQTCIGETTDGGATWKLVNGDASWVGTEGQVVYFLDNAKTWLWASSSNGFWRTEDGGATWKHIEPDIKEAHPQGSNIYRAKNGTFYLAASDGVFRSTDGKAWSMINGTGPLAGGLVSDGTTMYLSTDFYGDFGHDLKPYYTAPEDKGEPWTQMDSPGLTSGGTLGFDAGHRLLYSSNMHDGFLRVVVP